jgi:hypothetical protein
MKLFKSKKGQGLTLNTVIIAVLVLVVLAILIFIAYKYIWGAGSSIGELAGCQARTNDAGTETGKCVSGTETCNGNKFYKMGGCPDDTAKLKNYCCIPK